MCMNSSNQYVVLLDNETFGPYSLDTIRQMELMTDTLVKIQSSDEFRPALSYPELKDYLVSVENQQWSEMSIDVDTTSFYYREDGDMYGPLSIWELALLNIDVNSELSIDNMQTWTTANNIPGLIDLLRQISGEVEYDRINSDRQQIKLDKDQLEHVIRDQEEDLINTRREIQSKDKKIVDQQRELWEKQNEIERLKQKEVEKEQNLQKQQLELELMQSQAKISEPQWVEPPMFDFSADYKQKYASFEEQVSTALNRLNSSISEDEKFTKVFSSYDDEVEYNLGSYQRTTESLTKDLFQLQEIYDHVTNVYREDLQLLDASLSRLQHDSITQLNQKVKEAVEESKRQIRELEGAALSNKEHILGSLKRELEDKKLRITRQLDAEKQSGALKIAQVKSDIENIYQRILSGIHHVGEALQKVNKNSSAFFSQSYNTAPCLE